MATVERSSGRGGLVEVRRSEDRGHFDHGWLDAHHSFSFGDYHDPARMGFGALRVINEDRVAPGMGFGTHPHRDMEILTYVLAGTLVHADSLGHGGPIRAGEWQRITAGTGITHSERNGSDTEPVHLYQIWLLPDRRGLTPGYEQKSFDPEGRQGRWQVVASPDGREGSLTIRQDASVALARLDRATSIVADLATERRGWLQVASGRVAIGGMFLGPGDAATLAEGRVEIVGESDEAEVIWFDLA